MSTARARKLRRDATDAEKKLWRSIRDRQIHGVKFRRQMPMGPYFVDFVAFEARLIIELDGGQHTTDGPARTKYLEASGYRVLRFWNNEVLANLESVLYTVAQTLHRE